MSEGAKTVDGQARRSLLESAEKLRTIIENMPLGIAITTPDQRILVASPALVEMCGYSSPEEFADGPSSRHWLEPEERELYLRLLAASGVIRSYETRFVRKDGTAFWVSLTARIREAADGDSWIFTAIQDISPRKAAEARLAESEAERGALFARQKALLAALPDILMEVDSDKRYTWANGPGLEFFGEDVIGKEAGAYFIGEQGTYNAVRRVFSGDERVVYVESLQRRRDGEPRLLAWWCHALKDENGNVRGAISSAHDITESRESENRLQQQLDELRRWNEATLNRETRILDLKREVNGLLAELGRSPRYSSAEPEA